MRPEIQQRLVNVEAKLSGVADGSVTESVLDALFEDLQKIEDYAREAALSDIAAAIHRVIQLLQKSKTSNSEILRHKAAEIGGRVLATLHQHFNDVHGDGNKIVFSATEVVEPEKSTAEFTTDFLSDSEGHFSRLHDYSLRESDLSLDDIQEAFRLVHTIKGNAVALAIEALVPYASKFEEILSNVLGGTIVLNSRTQELLKKGCAAMSEHLKTARAQAAPAPAAPVLEPSPSAEVQPQQAEGYIVYRIENAVRRRSAEQVDCVLVLPKIKTISEGRFAVLVGLDWVEVRSKYDSAKRWGIVFRDDQGRGLEFADEILTIDRGIEPEVGANN